MKSVFSVDDKEATLMFTGTPTEISDLLNLVMAATEIKPLAEEVNRYVDASMLNQETF